VVRPSGRTAERIIGRIARQAEGIVTHEELVAAGVTEGEIKHRLQTGALIRKHLGVYRVGHQAPRTTADYLAAVKACGDRAGLSGRAAAHHLGLIKGDPPRPEVTCSRQRQIAGVITHHSRRLSPGDLTVHRGIPTTTVARTLVDLAAVLTEDDLARACHEAGVKYHASPTQVKAVLARRPNSPGAAKLRRIMSGETKVALSKLEQGFLDRLREEGLPLPETNRPAGGRRVDCRWPEHHLTVELDSYRYHRSRHAWEADREREREARRRGDEFRRFTWTDVFEDPRYMISELRQLLRTPSS
jgi:very-short-patch-repair endonuclease